MSHKPKHEVMIDLETLGTTYDSVILTIAAVKFVKIGNPTTELSYEREYDSFYRRMDIKSCLDIGLKVEQSTLEWWKKQSIEARRESLYNTDRTPIKTALSELISWLGNTEIFWANGSDFDYGILGTAYRACNLEIPWKFYNIRDARTIYSISRVNLRDEPMGDMLAHHALHDCYRQIACLQRAFKRLNI